MFGDHDDSFQHMKFFSKLSDVTVVLQNYKNIKINPLNIKKDNPFESNKFQNRKFYITQMNNSYAPRKFPKWDNN